MTHHRALHDGVSMTAPSAQHIGSAAVCELLGVDRSTLVRWVQSGKLTPAFKLPGSNGAYVFVRAEIELLREQRLVGATQ